MTAPRVEPFDWGGAPAQWDRLAEAAGNPFATRAWLEAWWRHFGAGRELVLLACRREGRLVAVLPLFLAASRPVAIARFLGHGLSDELGPVCAPADRALAAAALAGAPWDLLLADDVPGGFALPGARVLGRRPSPVVDLAAGDWEEFLAGRSRNFRREARKRERRLARRWRLRFRTTVTAEQLGRDLDTFFALHARRWGGASRAFGAGRAACPRDVAPALLEEGRLRLRFLELAGRAVAALYNLRCGVSEAAYQAGRDPAFDHFGVGTMLHLHAIRDALADGLREYRLLRGGEPYKLRLAQRDPGVRTLALARGARGAVALAGLGATRALPRRARRRLPAALAWGSGGA